MTRSRIAGAGLALLGAALAVLPALPWYSAPPAGDPTRASGLDGSGPLWTLPVLGLLVVLAGGALALGRQDAGPAATRSAGFLALGAGLAALAFAIWACLDPATLLTVSLPSGTETISAPVTLAAAAIATPIVAGAIAAIGAGLAWAGRRR